MKTLAIYTIISIIEFILVLVQCKVLMDKEERENDFKFKPKNFTGLENILAILKLILIFMTPILRTVLTFAILFSEDAQDSFIENLYENYTTENN